MLQSWMMYQIHDWIHDWIGHFMTGGLTQVNFALGGSSSCAASTCIITKIK